MSFKTQASLKAYLAHPRLYELTQRALGSVQGRQLIASKYIRARADDRVLDIGCGPAAILDVLPTRIEYVGVDSNPSYIEAAKTKYADRSAEFVCDSVGSYNFSCEGKFDIVLAVGVLHHLSDEEAARLLTGAERALRPSGRFVSVDCCQERRQPFITRALFRLDRGRYIRDSGRYLRLVRRVFPQATGTMERDLLRLPYSHLVIESHPQGLAPKVWP